MADYLLDSNVLIRHQPTTRLLATLVLDGQVGLATISRTELIEGMPGMNANRPYACWMHLWLSHLRAPLRI